MDGKNFTNAAEELKNLMFEQDEVYGRLYKTAKESAEKLEEAAKRGLAQDATQEEKKKLIEASLDLHKKLGAFLADVKKNEPGRFDSDTEIANVIVAYNMNANILVKAIEDVNGDILPDLIDSAFDNLVAEASRTDGKFEKENLENNLAKMLYLGSLKAEFDRVHGSEAEQKAWRSQILNELLTDRFEENVEKYKKTEFYKTALNKFKDAPAEKFDAVSCKKMLDEAVTERADDLYYRICTYFHIGPIIPEHTNYILDAKREIDGLRIMADSVGRKIENREGFKNFDEDEHFDTMDMVKRAKVFGTYDHSVDNVLYKKERSLYTQKRIKETNEKIVKDVDEEIARRKKPFPINDPVVENLVHGIAECDYLIAECKKNARETEEFSRMPEEAKNLEIRKYNLDRKNNEFKRENLYSILRMKCPNKAEYELNEMISIYKNTGTPDALRKKTILERQKNAKETFEILELGDFNNLKEEDFNFSSTAREYQNAKSFLLPDAEKAKKSVEKLKELDAKYKERSKCLYRKIEKDGVIRYERLSNEESKIRMQETRQHLKNHYNITDPSDLAFQNELKNNDNLEKIYQEKTLIEKPDRSAYSIPQYESGLAKNRTEDEVESGLNPDAVEIAKGIRVPEYSNFVPEEKTVNMEATEALDYAVSFGEEYENVMFGSEEYSDIMKELRLIQSTLRDESEPAERNIKRMIKTLAKMDQYIDRKRDERDASGKEGNNSRFRRLAMENGRNMLLQAIETVKIQNPEADRDYTIEKTTAEIENAMKLGEIEDKKAKEITELLKGVPRDFEGYKKGLLALKKYVLENADNYRKNGKYNFSLEETNDYRNNFLEEASGIKDSLKRIPKKGNERVFKTILTSFRNMQRSYLEYAEKNCPERLSEARFDAKFYQDEKGEFGETNKKFGLNTFIEEHHAEEIGLKPAGSIKEYRQQFEKQYKACMNEARYKNMENILNKKLGKSQIPLTAEGQNQMVDSALSLIFLDEYEKKVNEGQIEFDFNKMEKLRQQFLTLMRESTAVYEKMRFEIGHRFSLREACPALAAMDKILDEKYKKGDKEAENIRTIDEMAEKYPNEAGPYLEDAKKGPTIEELVALGEQKETEFSAPEDFRNKILPDAITNWVFTNVFCSRMMVQAGGKVDKARLNSQMHEIDTTLKIAKALKVDHIVEEKANALLLPGELKGEKLSDTIQLIKEAAMNKLVHKQVEAPKPISLG